MRLINADELMELYDGCDGLSVPIAVVQQNIKDATTIDAEPVRHGRWEVSIDEWFGTDVYTCSKCRESYVLVEGTPKENLWHYCPNCGAKMDGGNNIMRGELNEKV